MARSRPHGSGLGRASWLGLALGLALGGGACATEERLGSDAGGDDGPALGPRPERSECMRAYVEDPTQGVVWPARLSQTGCVVDATGRAFSADAVPYYVASELWTDGAVKHRAIAVPPGRHLTFEPDGTLRAPQGAVALKTFSHWRLEPGVAEPTLTPIETRVMVSLGHEWVFATYVWVGDDAELAEDWTVLELEALVAGQPAAIEHLVPSREHCGYCHRAPERELGLTVAQLNHPRRYDGERLDQLAAMDAIGLFQPALGELDGRPSLPAPTDPSRSLDERARAWLHANCAHCHRPGGWVPPGFTLDLRYEVPMAERGLCGAKAESFVPGVRLVPGQPDASLLVTRLSATDDSRMPPLGTRAVDPLGEALVRAWVAEQTGCP